ncbi:MAG: reverse transcriptase domain-containing protein [Myxococcota bacterium]
MLLNVLATEKIGWRTPTKAAFGETPDISAFLQFHFFQRVLYLDPNEGFPKTKEKAGHFVGVTDCVGDALTYWILTEETNQIIARGDVRPYNSGDLSTSNNRIPTNPATTTLTESAHTNPTEMLVTMSEIDGKPPVVLDPTGIVGTTYADTHNGHTQKAEVIKRTGENEWLVKFLHGGEELRSYNELINLINKPAESGNGLYTFLAIVGHRRQNGLWQVEVKWDTGELSWEPLGDIKATDPVTVAGYAAKHNLLDTTGWKWAKGYQPDGRVVKLLRRVLVAARKKARSGPVYKFGYRVPRTTRQAYQIDAESGTTKWKEAIDAEMKKMSDFGTFRPLGPDETLPDNYQKVPMHMCFDVKWDGRHKARLVAGGNFTTPDYQHDFNGTVSSESIRIGMFLASLHGLDVMVGDVSNAYLYAKTKEHVYTIAGPEFGELQGTTMVIEQACYGLRASNAAFGELLSSVLRNLGWQPSRADPKLWYRDENSNYDYLATYVDDLIFFSKDPHACIAEVQETFELKGVGAPEYFLGGDIGITENGVIYTGATKYIKSTTKKIEETMEIELKKHQVPMDPTYHAELDTTDLLNKNNHSFYRMIMGSAQWAVTLGRFDIAFATSTLARYAAAPRLGHLQAAIWLMGYLKDSPAAKILYNYRLPDYSDLRVEDHFWGDIYPDAHEELDQTHPEAKGPPVVLSIFVDADHARDAATRRSVTGILAFLNNTPI